jgi:uncharacterized protein (TIGR03086 family)
MLPSSPAARHRAVADRFTSLALAVPPEQWDAPAPVAGWTARDVVGHLVGWLPGFLESGAGVVLRSGPPLGSDPAGAWQAQAEQVQQLLEDESPGERMFGNVHTGEHPLPVAIDRFYTTDVFLHSWDLATATRQDNHLDLDTCAELLAGMEPIEQLMRASGQYGPRVDVPGDADVQSRLLGFIGRDPYWLPPVR